MKRFGALIAIVAAVAIACAPSSTAANPQPPMFPGQVEAYSMPNNFPVIQTWCLHGTRIVQTYYNDNNGYGSPSSHAMVAVPNDPTCF